MPIKAGNQTLTIFHRLREYARLMRLHRPIGALLLLWPTLWALWLAAGGRPDTRIVVIFIFGVVLMRSAGCVINDYADRDFDRHVRRTRDRPLTAGRVTAREALTLFVLLSGASLILVLQLNRLTVALSLAGALLTVAYPFMKRFTHLAQFYLGLAFSWGVVLAFAAEVERVPLIAWLIFAANLFWVMAYDTEYAMVDREDDLKIGIKSTAILFGRWDRFMVGISHGLAILFLALVGYLAALGAWYYLGLIAAACIAFYQQYLLRGREPQRCFRAFLNNNWFGASVFIGLVLDYIWE
ncbi:MAG TPA: 4-hydroxybenzoate octaprenyltransferase [Acidiferrobacterales bacterium]|nr:4-hydroxybenzoate octaprenyltransferase [Acidiferrobacterales bacterium]